MSNTKISALTNGNPALGTDVIPIDRAGANFSITPASIAAIPINAQGLGGFFSNGKLNYHGGEISGNPATVAFVTAVNQVQAEQFSLPAAFKLSRASTPVEVTTGLAALTLTSVATASAGSTVYTGTITGGAANAWAGATFVIAGFTTSANNGTFVCTASSATTLTLSNASGVSETHAATATPSSSKFAFAIYDSAKNLVCATPQFDGTNVTTGETQTFTEAILPPGTYYFAWTSDNLAFQGKGFLNLNLRQIWGNINASGYIRMGISSNLYAAGFPSSLGTLDGSGLSGLPVCFWEVN